jgi:hypothetical protein
MAVSVSNNSGNVELNDDTPSYSTAVSSVRKGSNVKFEDGKLVSVKLDNGNSVDRLWSAGCSTNVVLSPTFCMGLSVEINVSFWIALLA